MNPEDTFLKSVRDDLREDVPLASMLSQPLEMVIVPFQKSAVISFIGVTVVVKSEQVLRMTVLNVVNRIVPSFRKVPLCPNLWGFEILVCGICDGTPQRLIRVMIPATALDNFDSNQISNVSQNFAERTAGWIWYFDGKKLN